MLLINCEIFGWCCCVVLVSCVICVGVFFLFDFKFFITSTSSVFIASAGILSSYFFIIGKVLLVMCWMFINVLLWIIILFNGICCLVLMKIIVLMLTFVAGIFRSVVKFGVLSASNCMMFVVVGIVFYNVFKFFWVCSVNWFFMKCVRVKSIKSSVFFIAYFKSTVSNTVNVVSTWMFMFFIVSLYVMFINLGVFVNM